MPITDFFESIFRYNITASSSTTHIVQCLFFPHYSYLPSPHALKRVHHKLTEQYSKFNIAKKLKLKFKKLKLTSRYFTHYEYRNGHINLHYQPLEVCVKLSRDRRVSGL